MKQQIKASLVIAGCICILQSCAFRPCTSMTANIAGVNSRLVGDSFYGEIGLQAGILLSAKDNYNGESDDWKEYFKTFDLGIPLKEKTDKSS